jgi:Helix-loop-helix DNA-binding domain.
MNSASNLLSSLISNDVRVPSTLSQAQAIPSWLITRSNQNVEPLAVPTCVSSMSEAANKTHSLSSHLSSPTVENAEMYSLNGNILSRETGQAISDSIGSSAPQGLGFSRENIMPSHIRRKRKHVASANMRHHTTGRRSSDNQLPSSTNNKREIVSSISEDEDEREKRRKDRNMREQERSQRIAQQISELKTLLASSNVPFKPDKYSTLVSVHAYIKTLQQRAALLDEEQRKLVETLTQSNELVQKSQHGHQAVQNSQVLSPVAHQSASGHALIPSAHCPKTEDDEILGLVRGLDYKNVFSKIRIALCVTSIDGRLIDCNDEFVKVCGLSWISLISAGLREPQSDSELEYVGANPISLFNLIAREDMQKVFEAMSAMLKNVSNPAMVVDQARMTSSTDDYILQRHPSNLKTDHWSSEIRRCHNSLTKVSLHIAWVISDLSFCLRQRIHFSHVCCMYLDDLNHLQLQLNISLVRHKNGSPRFFNCALTTAE